MITANDRMWRRLCYDATVNPGTPASTTANHLPCGTMLSNSYSNRLIPQVPHAGWRLDWTWTRPPNFRVGMNSVRNTMPALLKAG